MKINYGSEQGSVAVPMLLLVVAVIIFFMAYLVLGEREQTVVDAGNGDIVSTTSNQVRAMRSNIDAAEQMQRTLNDRGENINTLMQDL